MWPDNWVGQTVYDRVKCLEPIYEHEYRELYGLLSWYAHSGSTGIAGVSKEGLEGLYGIAFDSARKKYLESLVVIAKVFHLFDVLKNLEPRLKYLKEAPLHILTKYSLDKTINHSQAEE